MIHPERRRENLKKIEEMDKHDAEPRQPDWKTWYMNKKVDMVEVIRCKDCRYWQDNNGGYPNPDCPWGKEETPDADDYCSFAERKEG